MSHMSNESDNRMKLKDRVESPSTDEGSLWGSSAGSGDLKKGPWTSAEDGMLVDYVKKHGEGNWNAVQKHSGLSRCGKSCRLRWANHLRPNLKKGAFTADEEQLIIELHAKMGNKWARMAAHLPGRTDNEIKNYWNTRIKRRQRAGLPLYPPNLCFQPLNENQQNLGGSDFSAGDRRNDELLQPNSYEIPDIIFDNLNANQGIPSYMPPFSDKSVSSMVSQGLGSQNCGFLIPTMKNMKRLRESDIFFPSSHSGGTCGLPMFGQFSNDSTGRIYRPFGPGFPYDPDPGYKKLALSTGTLSGRHALLNGNLSTSQPLPGTVKLELPSLQYQESDLDSFLMRPPTPPLEAEGAHIESPPTMVSMQSDCVSPRNSGLLEALLHEAHTMGIPKNQLLEKSSNSSNAMPSDLVDGSKFKPCNMDWEGYNDPISPLGHSATSVFNACTPPISGSSPSESSPGKTPAGMNIKSEIVECVSTQDVEETEDSPRLFSPGPDALLGSDWCPDSSKDDNILTDGIATLLGEDFCSESKHAPVETSWLFGQGLAGVSTFQWNDMPSTIQLSEFP